MLTQSYNDIMFSVSDNSMNARHMPLQELFVNNKVDGYKNYLESLITI